MDTFKISILDKFWINGDEESCKDLCLHGKVCVVIGNELIADNYECTISSTALYLLKSLTRDHLVDNTINQMLPCCGHFIMPMDDGTVEISGCPVGIDWEVIHIDDYIRITSRNGAEVTLSNNEYREIIINCVDEIEEFYINSDKKVLPDDDFCKRGYKQFWNEWHQRRHDK